MNLGRPEVFVNEDSPEAVGSAVRPVSYGPSDKEVMVATVLSLCASSFVVVVPPFAISFGGPAIPVEHYLSPICHGLFAGAMTSTPSLWHLHSHGTNPHPMQTYCTFLLAFGFLLIFCLTTLRPHGQTSGL